jgi:hypothetical protein
MMIMSIAVVAMCELVTAGTAHAVSGGELTTAVNLANTIHEGAVIGQSRDIWDLNGRTFQPAIDGTGAAIAGDQAWSQQVVVQAVDNRNIGAVADEATGLMARMTVTVYHNGHYVYSGSWLMAADDPS